MTYYEACEQLAEAWAELRHAVFVELVRLLRIEQLLAWIERRGSR